MNILGSFARMSTNSKTHFGKSFKCNDEKHLGSKYLPETFLNCYFEEDQKSKFNPFNTNYCALFLSDLPPGNAAYHRKGSFCPGYKKDGIA